MYISQKLISGLTIGPMDSLVAVVEYSDTARVEWYLTDHSSVRDLENAAMTIPYVQGKIGFSSISRRCLVHVYVQAVASSTQKFYTHCSVLIGSRNGFECFYKL